MYIHSILIFSFWIFLSQCKTQEVNQASNNQITSKEVVSSTSSASKKAYLASGCFWCVEAIYEQIDGVSEVISGYSGGKKNNPSYEEVGSKKTGHAETVEIFYDPSKVSFKKLIEVYYATQDPTTYGQKPDFGNSYRSIIFYQTEDERLIAETAKSKISNEYKEPVVTEIIKFERFWPAESYHQNFEHRNPNHPYVRSVSIPRLKRFQVKFPELLKAE